MVVATPVTAEALKAIKANSLNLFLVEANIVKAVVALTQTKIEACTSKVKIITLRF